MQKKNYGISLVLILLYILMSKFIALFGEYVFNRIGVSRDILLILLWVLPFLASFIVARYSSRYQILLGLSLGVLTTILSVLVNYVMGILGYGVDFAGISGSIVLFKILLFIYIPISILGTIFGITLSAKKSHKIE